MLGPIDFARRPEIARPQSTCRDTHEPPAPGGCPSIFPGAARAPAGARARRPDREEAAPLLYRAAERRRWGEGRIPGSRAVKSRLPLPRGGPSFRPRNEITRIPGGSRASPREIFNAPAVRRSETILGAVMVIFALVGDSLERFFDNFRPRGAMGDKLARVVALRRR